MTRVFLSIALLFAATALQADEYDIVIYGGTSSGVMAGVQAARMGKSVVIVEPGKHLGGLTSGGLGWTDSGDKRVIGGLAREFYQRVKKHYDRPESWKHGDRKKYSRYRAADDAMWTFEPRVAEAIFERIIEEHRIPVQRNQRLNRASGVKVKDGRIVSMSTESGQTYRGRMFIDATYEGDLMAAAGVSFFVGRESNAKYDEQLEGVQKRQNTHSHRFIKRVDPYVKPGVASSGLLPGVHGDPPGEEGAGDRRVQAYCFRMCLSNVPANQTPFPKPADYDEARYELLLRNFEAGDLRFPMKNDMMPNGKTDTNNNCAFSTDNLGMNYDYPEGSYEQRARILREHESYQKGLMWTLANHPRVPASIRREMNRWGLAKDEFIDNGNWPHQIYVREARRMVGAYVMTEKDCRRIRMAEDSVGLGSYNMDSHNVQRYVTPEGFVQNEGDVQVSPGGAYLISYRSLTPARNEVVNLLAPVCLSSSHIAYGSIRMEPVFMILGQSAATAAALAIDADSTVQEVPYARLRKRLLADKQVLDLPEPTRPKIYVAAARLKGVVIDDTRAEFVGVWTASASTTPYVESGYRHDGNVERGAKTATFATTLKPGRYEVRISYSAHANRATNARMSVKHAEGTFQATVNQRRKPELQGLFHSLGTFAFSKRPAEVAISNQGADGYVIVDAVQFLPKP